MFMLLGLILFIASGVLAVGVFLYVQFLNTTAASKLDQLNRAKAAFEPALIAELTRLDDRMRAADEVLSIHVAPSALFNVLQQLTLQTVAFSSLDFSAQNSSDMTLAMQGIAQSVNSIALEADLLSKSGVITSPIFSNMNRTPQGVRFDFTSGINPSGLRYRSVRSGAAMQPQAAPEEPATPFGLPQDMTAVPDAAQQQQPQAPAAQPETEPQL
jgi:hypothetical protein